MAGRYKTGSVLNAAAAEGRVKDSYHQHQDHGTLVDVVCVDASSLPEPAPETSAEAVSQSRSVPTGTRIYTVTPLCSIKNPL